MRKALAIALIFGISLAQADENPSEHRIIHGKIKNLQEEMLDLSLYLEYESQSKEADLGNEVNAIYRKRAAAQTTNDALSADLNAGMDTVFKECGKAAAILTASTIIEMAGLGFFTPHLPVLSPKIMMTSEERKKGTGIQDYFFLGTRWYHYKYWSAGNREFDHFEIQRPSACAAGRAKALASAKELARRKTGEVKTMTAQVINVLGFSKMKTEENTALIAQEKQESSVAASEAN